MHKILCFDPCYVSGETELLLLSIAHIREPDPTLLHFAARFNLIKLAVGILKCPGGYDALNMINIDGLSPSQIAHECGHEHLATVLVRIVFQLPYYGDFGHS